MLPVVALLPYTLPLTVPPVTVMVFAPSASPLPRFSLP